jgi:hypothetical protein
LLSTSTGPKAGISALQILENVIPRFGADVSGVYAFPSFNHNFSDAKIQNQEELEKSIMPSLDMIGVNNRNLKTFEVSLDFSKELADQIPNEFVKVSESGISSIEAISELKPYGYQGFLIGENFMKTDNAGQAAKEFIAQLK